MAFPSVARLGVVLSSVVLFWTSLAWPCTTFLAEHGGQFVFGKNYDWYESAGLVVVNPRNLSKIAFVLKAEDTPATWISHYGSVTFNQYGVELPNGGVNEKGLVIETMVLDKTHYPAADARPVLNELQWMQHALDRFATVDELLEAAPSVRISEAHAKLHYLVCDANGACAAIEYLEGQLAVTRGAALVRKTLANDSYQDSLAYLVPLEETGGLTLSSTSMESLDRFARVALAVKNVTGTLVPDSGFTMLDSVRQSSTVWSTVYALGEGVAYFQTKANAKVKTVPYLNLDYANCKRQILDIHSDFSGDVTARLEDYSTLANLRLLQKTMASMAAHFPPGTTERLAAYPNTLACASEKGVDAGAEPTVMNPDGGAGFRWDGGSTTTPNKASKGGCSIGTQVEHSGIGFLVLGLGLIGMIVLRPSRSDSHLN